VITQRIRREKQKQEHRAELDTQRKVHEESQRSQGLCILFKERNLSFKCVQKGKGVDELCGYCRKHKSKLKRENETKEAKVKEKLKKDEMKCTKCGKKEKKDECSSLGFCPVCVATMARKRGLRKRKTVKVCYSFSFSFWVKFTFVTGK
jgi:predicted RNA-binding Zn-ribbon protein involved in translation (DUF1610 family)